MSGVASKLLQVSRDRSAAIPSAPKAAAVAPTNKEKKTVMNRRKTLKSILD